MFIGHFAASFAAKRVSPRTSLGTLIAAATFLDLIWPLLLLAGFEKVVVSPGITAFTPLDFTDYPISHSLLMAVVWGMAFGAVYFWRRRAVRASIVVGLLVVSHWVLDFLTHRPDLPLVPGGAEYGLGLWNSVPGTIVVEVAMFAAAVWLYTGVTAARDRAGSWGWWGFVVFLLSMYAANILGPPPPDQRMLAWFAMLAWLFVPVGLWVDRHRLVTGLEGQSNHRRSDRNSADDQLLLR